MRGEPRREEIEVATSRRARRYGWFATTEERRVVHVERVEPLAVEIGPVAEFARAAAHDEANAFALARDDRAFPSKFKREIETKCVLHTVRQRLAHRFEQMHDVISMPVRSQRR